MKNTVFTVLYLGLCFATLCSSQTSTSVAPARAPVLMCYWGSWAVWREPPAQLLIENFDPFLCTHLIFAFAGLREGDSAIIDLESPELYTKMTDLKKKNPNLKTLLAIGGWGQRAKVFSRMAADDEKIRDFVKNAVSHVVRYKFDGIDIDWEFPGHDGQGGNPKIDKQNFVDLLEELNKELKNENPNYLLTVAVGTSPFIIGPAYNITEIDKHVDYINLMAYDLRMYLPSDTKIGHHSPLSPSFNESDTSPYITLNDEAIVETFVSEGASPEKLVLGVGTYGKSYTISSRSKHNFGDEATGAGPAGAATNSLGSLAYFEFCLEFPRSKSRWEFHFDEDQQIPYAFNDTMWIGFDDEESAMRKTAFAMEQGLGGMMVWSLEQDDCNNICEGWYNCPITSAIKAKLEQY